MSRIEKIHVEYHEFPEMKYDHNDLMKFLVQAGFEVTLQPWHLHFGYMYGEKASGAAQTAGQRAGSGRGAGKGGD